MSLETLMWTERHRPSSLDELAMSEENRALIEQSLEDGEIPHLLLAGPAGCGKTSISYIIRDRLDCQDVVLNASKDRGIDVVRDKIGTFSRGLMGSRWNLVILDEADALTRDAQTALRNQMETHADRTRFILTCNFLHRIIDPIQSRCMVVEMARMSKEERFRVLSGILRQEGVESEPQIILSYVETYTDLRRMINAAQRSVLAHGGELRPARASAGADGASVLGLAQNPDQWSEVVEVSRDDGTDHRALLTDMFWAVADDHPRAATLRVTLAEAVDETTRVPDQVVHFLGTCAEISEIVGG